MPSKSDTTKEEWMNSIDAEYVNMLKLTPEKIARQLRGFRQEKRSHIKKIARSTDPHIVEQMIDEVIDLTYMIQRFEELERSFSESRETIIV